MDEKWTHDDWVQLLGGFYFNDAHEGDAILFAVDDLALEEVSGLPSAEACESLAAVLRPVLMKRLWHVGAIKMRVQGWRRDGCHGDHPALPFLAFTVLAASRMGGANRHAHNFYGPLRYALYADDDEIGEPGSYLENIRWLWNDLATWANVDLGGRRGRLIVRDPGVHYGRGLAMQHAIIKSYDLRQLDAFFRRIGLRPGEDVSAAELLRALTAWTTGRDEPWAKRLNRLCTDPELKEHAEGLLEREARRWDGQPRDPRTGRPIGRIRVGFRSLRRPEVGLYLQWTERIPEKLDLKLNDGSAITVTRRDGWLEPCPLPIADVAGALRDGLPLRAEGQQFDLRAEHAYALTYDDDLGAWTSADSLSFGERCHLLVRSELALLVVNYLSSVSKTDARVDEASSRSLPRGWKLVTPVQLDSRPKLSPPSCLASLIPVGGGPRLRLLGGLPLSAAHGVYLRGGEPALALSTLCADDSYSITRTSSGQVHTLKVPSNDAREVPLWQFKLEPDHYEIRHGESKVQLQIVDGIAESAGRGAGSVTLRGRDGAIVSGTSVTPQLDHRLPITVPAPRDKDGSVMVLGAKPGELVVTKCPPWLAPLVGFDLSWRFLDAWPDFDPVWLVLRGPTGRLEASLLSRREPVCAIGAIGSDWARTICVARLFATEDEEIAGLWARYRSVAGCPDA